MRMIATYFLNCHTGSRFNSSHLISSSWNDSCYSQLNTWYLVASKNEIFSRIYSVNIGLEEFTIFLTSFLSVVRIKPQPIFVFLWLCIAFSISLMIFSAYSLTFIVFYFYSSSLILQQQRFLTPCALLTFNKNLSDGNRSSSAIDLSQHKNYQHLHMQVF